MVVKGRDTGRDPGESGSNIHEAIPAGNNLYKKERCPLNIHTCLHRTEGVGCEVPVDTTLQADLQKKVMGSRTNDRQLSEVSES